MISAINDKKRVLLIFAVLISLLAGLSVWWLQTNRFSQAENQSYRQLLPESTRIIKPPRNSQGDVIVVTAGDIACDKEKSDKSCRHEATAELIRKIDPEAVLPLGDLQYGKGEYRNFLKFYDRSWGAFKPISYPVPGNHDYETRGATGYFDYFNGLGKENGLAGERSKGYYSFDLGKWHLVALNSNCAAVGGCQRGSPQETWLRQDLVSHPNKCTLAYFHHLRFSSGGHGSNPQYTDFWQALYDYNVDVVLGGHDHDYERFAPQDPWGNLDSQKGIGQFVVGTGGNEIYALKSTQPNSQVSSNETQGVLKMTLRETSYDWEFVPIAGGSFTDSGRSFCH